MVELMTDIFCVLAIYLIISTVWAVAEKVLYGKAVPKKIDDVVAMILAVSLFYNFI